MLHPKPVSVATSLLDALPDVIVWVTPVYGKQNEVEDFRIAFSNRKADAAFLLHDSISGLCILRDNFPSALYAAETFTNLLDAFRTGKAKEFFFYVISLNRFVDIQTQPHDGGLLCLTRDRVAQIEAEKKEQKTSRTLKSIISNSAVGIIVFEALRDGDGMITDFILRLHNERSNQLTGMILSEGVSLKTLLHEINSSMPFEHYVEVVRTGVPAQQEQYLSQVDKWIASSVTRLDDGFVSMLSDITEVKKSQNELKQQKEYLNNVLDTSLNAVVTMEAVRDENEVIVDLRYKQVNNRFVEWLSVVKEQVIDQTMLQFFPNTKDSGIFDVYRTVIETGEPQHREIYYSSEEINCWFDLSVARFDEKTAVGTFNDVTKSKAAFEELEKQKSLLDNILKYSSNGISVPEMMRNEAGEVIDARTILVNEAAVKFTGLSKEVYLSKTAVELEPNILKSPYYQLCLKTLETGESSLIQYQLESTGKWLEISISKMDADRLITIFTDISPTKAAQLAKEHAAAKTRAVVDTAQTGVFTGSPIMDTTGTIIDFRFTLVNKALAAFTDQEPDALIGELGSRWFARYKANGLFDALKTTYETGERSQFDFFYEGNKFEAWINIVITRLEDEVIGTFTDFSSLKKIQQQLERTVEELQRSNANLQEFAYAASHDLKEPVRKVRIFSDQLNKSLSERMTEEERSYFIRMDRASARMSSLIDDLLSYSEVSLSAKAFELVDMNQLMDLVLTDLDLEIEEKGASVKVGSLFIIQGYPRQLQQAFQNLIGNALKYCKPGVPPVINITCEEVLGSEIPESLPTEALHQIYYCLTVADNGVGFESKDAERIFNVFTRLHGTANYKGSGVGLSIVRKVMENHNGYVTAYSSPGVGSRFMIYLPAYGSK